MTVTENRRRRWPWAIAAVVVLLVVAPIAWQFRPLNATERRLIGTWAKLPAADQTLDLHADRSWSGTKTTLVPSPNGDPLLVSESLEGGTWVASATRIRLDYPAGSASTVSRIADLYCRMVFGVGAADAALRFDESPDRIWINNDEYLRAPK